MPSKLVRDRIIEIINSRQRGAQFHIADDAEYHTRLRDKLREETEEFLASDSPEELADIFEVLQALCLEKNITWNDVVEIARKKQAERGAFNKRHVLDT